ncbi:SCO2400 family protein [Streptomyces sp. NPDC002523]
MDYCSSCRRHLNGALVCPGCGAYAPDIAPSTAATGRSAAAVGPAAQQLRTGAPSYGDDLHGPHGDLQDLQDLQDFRNFGDLHAPHHAAAFEDDLHNEAAPDDADGTTRFQPSGEAGPSFDAPRGRAARRRQLARWKKNKRRAAVATAVALVGGGITLASMNGQSTDRTQAASAPDNRSMGAAGDETTGEASPEPSAPGTHHPAHPTSPAHPQRATAGTPYQRAAHTAAAPRTAVTNAHTDAAAAPVPARTLAVPHRISTPVTGGGTTSTGHTSAAPTQQPASTPKPAQTGGTGTSGTPPQTSPSPAATSPNQLCLVVLCLG